MPPSLHLLLTDSVPMLDEQEREMLMLETEEGLPADGPQEEGVYRFGTALWANHEDQNQLRVEVCAWWQELAGVIPYIEFLTSDPALMSEETAHSAASLPLGTWEIGSFVGFLRGSLSANKAAREFLRDTFMKMQ